MKRLVPLLALVPLIVSYGTSGNFVLPTMVLVTGFALLLAVLVPDQDSDWVPALGLFWLGPLSVVWSVSERREGRDIWQYGVAAGLLIAAIGTAVLLRRPLLKHHIALVLAAVLTWCVSYFGGSSGSADNMKPLYSLFGLSPDATWALILMTRKVIHVTFYSALATCFYQYFLVGRRNAVVPSLTFTLVMACCDEWRQSMMPNRAGSVWDVILDTGAAFIWLWWCSLRKRSTNSAAPSSDVHA